jgi:FO synthase
MTGERIWAVVPVKPFHLAKRRLAPVLGESERAQLARVMFEDVLDALTGAQSLTGIIVVTNDDEAAALARRHGATVLADAVEGINAALGIAVKHLAAEPHTAMLVVPSDLPQLTADRIDEIVRDLPDERAVALVSSEDGGTNLLTCQPADAIAPCFGVDSFAAHCQAARQAGVQPFVISEKELGRDIDKPEDLAAFLSFGTETRTHAFLSQKTRSRIAPDATLSRAEALALADCDDLDALMHAAASRRDAAHGNVVSYSRKVFIPLTKLCRDVCHYCTFAQPPRAGEAAFLSLDEVLAIARAGKEAGCKEALFTLGDKPELRYRAAREALGQLGHETTLSYLAEAARVVFDETGLLPHVNPGLLDADDIAALRKVSASQGIMLESAAERLCQRGGPHFGSSDKRPAARLETIRLAGEQQVPFTSGILIGIGETRRERIEALLALRDLHDQHGHIQEIIIQNFRPKPGTRMAQAEAPSIEEL